MAIDDRIRELIAPVLAEREVDLYDLEFAGGVLRITVDRTGGVDIGTIGKVTRDISRLIDEHDPIPGAFTLEVSSPGLERPLRTPEHYLRAVGEKVNVKTRAGVDGDRRFVAVIASADDDTVTLTPADGGDPRVLAYDDIERARTLFDWGPTSKPGQSPSSKKKAAKP